MSQADYSYELPPFRKNRNRQERSSPVVSRNAKKVKPVRIREKVALVVDEEGNVVSEVPLKDTTLKRVMSSAKAYSQTAEMSVSVYIAKKRYDIPYEVDFKEEWYD